MIILRERFLTISQIQAAEVLLFELNNNLREVVRVMCFVTGFTYRKVLKEIKELFEDRLNKRRSKFSSEMRKKEGIKNKNLRKLKKERLEKSQIEIQLAEKKELIETHKNKLLAKKWV